MSRLGPGLLASHVVKIHRPGQLAHLPQLVLPHHPHPDPSPPPPPHTHMEIRQAQIRFFFHHFKHEFLKHNHLNCGPRYLLPASECLVNNVQKIIFIFFKRNSHLTIHLNISIIYFYLSFFTQESVGVRYPGLGSLPPPSPPNPHTPLEN